MSYQIEIVSIEGNIGSGKSTLLANLKNHLNKNTKIVFLREPVDEWSKITDEKGITILEKFYADQEKYSFSFQMMAYISRLKLLKDTIKDIKTEHAKFMSYATNHNWELQSTTKYVIITERSLYTDKLVFAKMLYDSGKIEHINYQIYLNWFETFAEEYSVDKIIYVKADPQICHQRIEKRNRDGESSISIEYLTSCSEYHEKMLDKSSDNFVFQKQLILNGNKDIYTDEFVLSEWIESIKNFIF